MKQLATLLCVGAVLALAACGGGDGPIDPDEDENSLTGSVGSDGFTATNFGAPIQSGTTITFWGSQVTGSGNTHRIDFTLSPITAPGNFPAGPGGTSYITYREVGSGGVTRYWRSGLTGGSGSITVSTLTSSRIAGSFTVVVGPDTGSTGTKTISGNFEFLRP